MPDKRLWLAVKVGTHVLYVFPFTGERGHDRDGWSGYGVLLGTRGLPNAR